MTSDKKLGIFYAAFACCTWGTVFVLTKWLIALKGVPALSIAFWRFAVCSIFLIGLVVVRGRAKSLVVVVEQPVRFVVLGFLGGYAMYLLVLEALSLTTANNAQIIMNSNPIFIAPLALLIGERMQWRGVLGLCFGLAGCVMVSMGTANSCDGGGSQHLLGGVVAALGGVTWASYTVLGRNPIRQYGGVLCTTIAMTMGTVMLAVHVFVVRAPVVLTLRQMLPLVYLGLVPTALGFAAWFKAMETLPANVVGPFQFLQPVIGITLAVCFLGERLTLTIGIGALLAFTGVYFTTRESDS